MYLCRKYSEFLETIHFLYVRAQLANNLIRSDLLILIREKLLNAAKSTILIHFLSNNVGQNQFLKRRFICS